MPHRFGRTYQLVQVNSAVDFQLLGQTRDDAAGEAFDKIGKLLGCPIPPGRCSTSWQRKATQRFHFADPQLPGLDYSFSGLKTAVLYFLEAETRKNPDFIAQHLHDLCASVQHTLVRYLLSKLRLAARQSGLKQIAIAGGVAANSGLRAALAEMAGQEGWTTFIPALRYCTDNAGMVAMRPFPLHRRPFPRANDDPDPRLSLQAS